MSQSVGHYFPQLLTKNLLVLYDGKRIMGRDWLFLNFDVHFWQDQLQNEEVQP
jgi:hypothetical protein